MEKSGGEKFPHLDYTSGEGDNITIVGNLIAQLRSNQEQTAGRLRYNRIGVSKAGEDKLIIPLLSLRETPTIN